MRGIPKILLHMVELRVLLVYVQMFQKLKEDILV